MPGDLHTLPARLGRYELVDHIATGGMADVFLARSFGVQGFRKHVVVKRLRPGLAQAPRFVKMFIQEARISAGLVHPNVVQIHELGAAPGRGGDVHFIAMEYIHGQDLAHVRRALAAQDATLPPALALYCAIRVLRALAYAHARVDTTGHALGLVHRDVSPHNVLVSFQGEVKLVDFGIARIEGESAGGNLPGGGKYAYMSPEQAEGGPVGSAGDVFSAGIVLWELLVGRRLFQHSDPGEKLRRVRAAEIPDPRRENPAVSDALWVLLQQILAHDAADRPTARQAEEALQALLFDQGLRADAGSLGRMMSQLFPEQARRDPGRLDLEGLAADLARLQQMSTRAAGAGLVDGAASQGSSQGSSDPRDMTGERTETDTGSAASQATASESPALLSLPALRGLATVERKPVVVLVGEVTGFTEPSTQHDPEVIARGHYRLLRRMRRVVDRHGGWLDRFHDDRFTVFFGVPRTGEHDLDHALACAGQLVRVARRLRRRGVAVSLSIGVNQGELSLGQVQERAGRKLRYLSSGDTTKLARRLCQLADIDQVLVSDRVCVLARDRFHFRVGPAVRKRGKPDAGKSWQLAGRDTGVHATLGRWLARGDEREVIIRALRRVATGQRVFVAVQGPPGSGKSRLVQELRDLAAARGVPVYAARAVPYAADRPLATLRDVVARVMGLSSESEPTQVRAGLERLSSLGLDPADIRVIGALFGVEADLLGARAVDDLVGAAGRFVCRLAASGAVLLAIEDAQHLSEIEHRVLHYIQASTADVPLLMLLTLRGPVPPGLGPVDEEIVLGPLSPLLQRRLAAQLLGVRQIDAGLAAHIVAATEGNPRYLVALIEALREQGRIDIVGGKGRLLSDGALPSLPDGLDGIISARVDALSEQARQALQVAAIIGSRLSVGLLAEATGQADLRPVMTELLAGGLVEREGDELAFASELVAEVTVRTLVGARRRELHALVASAMERHLGLDGPHVGELAEQCAACGRLLDAARCGHTAGDRLRRQQLLRPAVHQWGRALGWLAEATEQGADPDACLRGEAMLHFKVGEARELLGEGMAAQRHLQAALDAASDCEDDELQARCMLALGRVFVAGADLARARLHLEAARDATVVPGPDAQWRREVAVESLEALGVLAGDAGDADEAEACYRAALDRAADDDALASRALLGLSARHIRSGDEDAALDLLAQAGARAASAKDRILLGRILNNTGLVHHGAGRFREAIACFEESRDLRCDTGYRKGEAANLHNIGDSWVRLGQPARAFAAFERSRDLARGIAWRRGIVMNDVWMAWLEASRSGGSEDVLVAAVEAAEGLADRDTALTGQWLLGRLLCDRGDHQRGKTVLQDALARAQAMGAEPICRDIVAALGARGDCR
ncbi:MAG: protein kinase [Oligoflexia bacterium]|nr:protein kinase [Oligoflexia bacterium]